MIADKCNQKYPTIKVLHNLFCQSAHCPKHLAYFWKKSLSGVPSPFYGNSKLHKYFKLILPVGEESAIFTSTIRQIFYCCLRTCFLPFHYGRNFLILTKNIKMISPSKSMKIWFRNTKLLDLDPVVCNVLPKRVTSDLWRFWMVPHLLQMRLSVAPLVI